MSDITFAANAGMDYIAASFVRSADDAMQIRRLQSLGSNMGIIAKIENQEGVDNIDEILKVVDGVMVARGDFGYQRFLWKMFLLSKADHRQMLSWQTCRHGNPNA